MRLFKANFLRTFGKQKIAMSVDNFSSCFDTMRNDQLDVPNSQNFQQGNSGF